MMKPYALLTSALLLVTFSASAQGLKPGIHPRPNNTLQQRGDAPANDECAGAISLTVGATCSTTDGNSATATQSMDPAAEGCGTNFVSPEAFDTWYSFVATSASTTVDVMGVSTYDAVVQVFSGTCGSLTAIGCADVNYPLDPPVGNMTESAAVETTPGTTYYARVYYYSSPVPVDFDYTICAYQTPAATEYCIPSTTEACDESIAGFAFGSLDYSSDCTEGGYVDYTGQNANVTAGTSVSVTVTGAEAYYTDDAVGVWGDWNQDFTFTPSERTLLTSADEGMTFTGSVAVPAGAFNGETRLRVRMVYDLDPMPCGETAYGETEDYSVTVSGGVAIGITETPAALAFSVYPNPSNGNVTLTYMDATSTVNIELLDMAGRIVHAQQRMLNKGQNVVLDLSGKVAAGNYALRLTSVHGRSAQHLVVK